MFKQWRQKRSQNESLVLDYLTTNSDVIPLGNQIGIGTLYSTLKRLRRKGLIYSLPGEAIAGGARKQLYFISQLERFELSKP